MSRDRRWPWTAGWSCSNAGEEEARAVPGPREVGRRIGGAVGAAGGASLVLYWIVVGGDRLSEAATSATFFLPSGTRLLAMLLLAFGLVALYVRQTEASGTLGLAGFSLALIGTTLAAGALWSQVGAASGGGRTRCRGQGHGVGARRLSALVLDSWRGLGGVWGGDAADAGVPAVGRDSAHRWGGAGDTAFPLQGARAGGRGGLPRVYPFDREGGGGPVFASGE